MTKIIYPGQTIGIIGGGQLGRMMALAAKESGFKIAVLEPAMDSPCGQVADVRIVAPYDDEAALEELAEVSDVITYEFEKFFRKVKSGIKSGISLIYTRNSYSVNGVFTFTQVD